MKRESKEEDKPIQSKDKSAASPSNCKNKKCFKSSIKSSYKCEGTEDLCRCIEKDIPLGTCGCCLEKLEFMSQQWQNEFKKLRQMWSDHHKIASLTFTKTDYSYIKGHLKDNEVCEPVRREKRNNCLKTDPIEWRILKNKLKEKYKNDFEIDTCTKHQCPKSPRLKKNQHSEENLNNSETEKSKENFDNISKESSVHSNKKKTKKAKKNDDYENDISNKKKPYKNKDSDKKQRISNDSCQIGEVEYEPSTSKCSVNRMKKKSKLQRDEENEDMNKSSKNNKSKINSKNKNVIKDVPEESTEFEHEKYNKSSKESKKNSLKDVERRSEKNQEKQVKKDSKSIKGNEPQVHKFDESENRNKSTTKEKELRTKKRKESVEKSSFDNNIKNNEVQKKSEDDKSKSRTKNEEKIRSNRDESNLSNKNNIRDDLKHRRRDEDIEYDKSTELRDNSKDKKKNEDKMKSSFENTHSMKKNDYMKHREESRDKPKEHSGKNKKGNENLKNNEPKSRDKNGIEKHNRKSDDKNSIRSSKFTDLSFIGINDSGLKRFTDSTATSYTSIDFLPPRKHEKLSKDKYLNDSITQAKDYTKKHTNRDISNFGHDDFDPHTSKRSSPIRRKSIMLVGDNEGMTVENENTNTYNKHLQDPDSEIRTDYTDAEINPKTRDKIMKPRSLSNCSNKTSNSSATTSERAQTYAPRTKNTKKDQMNSNTKNSNCKNTKTRRGTSKEDENEEFLEKIRSEKDAVKSNKTDQSMTEKKRFSEECTIKSSKKRTQDLKENDNISKLEGILQVDKDNKFLDMLSSASFGNVTKTTINERGSQYKSVSKSTEITSIFNKDEVENTTLSGVNLLVGTNSDSTSVISSSSCTTGAENNRGSTEKSKRFGKDTFKPEDSHLKEMKQNSYIKRCKQLLREQHRVNSKLNHHSKGDEYLDVSSCKSSDEEPNAECSNLNYCDSLCMRDTRDKSVKGESMANAKKQSIKQNSECKQKALDECQDIPKSKENTYVDENDSITTSEDKERTESRTLPSNMVISPKKTDRKSNSNSKKRSIKNKEISIDQIKLKANQEEKHDSMDSNNNTKSKQKLRSFETKLQPKEKTQKNENDISSKISIEEQDKMELKTESQSSNSNQRSSRNKTNESRIEEDNQNIVDESKKLSKSFEMSSKYDISITSSKSLKIKQSNKSCLCRSQTDLISTHNTKKKIRYQCDSDCLITNETNSLKIIAKNLQINKKQFEEPLEKSLQKFDPIRKRIEILRNPKENLNFNDSSTSNTSVDNQIGFHEEKPKDSLSSKKSRKSSNSKENNELENIDAVNSFHSFKSYISHYTNPNSKFYRKLQDANLGT